MVSITTRLLPPLQDTANITDFFWGGAATKDSSQSTYADFMKHTFHAMHPTYLSELIGDKRLQKNPRRTYSEDLNTALINVLTMNYPPELEWILCNITKRVCVTAKGITERTGVSPRWGPFFKAPVNFALILMLKITWSTDDNLSMNYQGGIHQGPWACDRFEITTMDRLDQVKPVHDGVKTDWKDVSKEVMEEIVEIAKAEIGVEYERIVFSRFKRPLRHWNERWFVNMEDD